MTTIIQKKVCLLGDFSVGKTSLVQRFIYNRFRDEYLSTIGVKIARKSIILDDEATLNMFIWDLAGSKEFTGVHASYLQGTHGALLVCDLTRPETLLSLKEYRKQLYAIAPDVPLIVIANKVDLETERKIPTKTLDELARSFDTHAVTTSAKTGHRIEEVFTTLAQSLR